MNLPHTPLVLCILDGFGWRTGPGSEYGNAVALAEPRFYQGLLERYPHTTLACMGPAVGLPEGQMGNSEVGHMTIGAGRVVEQDLVRIGNALRDGRFARQPAWHEFLAGVRADGGRVHLLGLVSPGGVHSHTDHLYGILELLREAGQHDVFVHVILDGRDTDPRAGLVYVEELQRKLAAIGVGRIASVSGRYYAMDRDKRWDRVEKAWRVLVHGEGPRGRDPLQVIRDSYAAGVTDEFVVPTVITGDDDRPVAVVRDGDGVFFWNFRADRARELTWAFNSDDFDGFPRPLRPRVHYLCLTQYDEELDVPVLFPPYVPERILGEVLAEHGVGNLRTAETEKYAHVTYFLNGGREEPFPGEDRRLVPSPRVATYDLQPEMSAPEVAAGVLDDLSRGAHPVIVVNFANGDMVGHTGVLEAAVQAVKTLDGLLARIVPAVLERGGVMLLTADHGNCEEMLDPDGRVLTNHSLNPVPFVLIGEEFAGRGAAALRGDPDRGLRDIAPTLLALLGLPVPPEMTGRPLLAAKTP